MSSPRCTGHMAVSTAVEACYASYSIQAHLGSLHFAGLCAVLKADKLPPAFVDLLVRLCVAERMRYVQSAQSSWQFCSCEACNCRLHTGRCVSISLRALCQVTGRP